MLVAFSPSLSGLVINGPVVRGGAAARTAAPLMMPVAKIPGEGDPFNVGPDGQSNMRRAEDIAAYQPRGISDGSANMQYIETEDEPWCASTHKKLSLLW